MYLYIPEESPDACDLELAVVTPEAPVVNNC